MAKGRRVVVTGLGVATPIGLGMEAFWEALIQRQSGIRRIATFDPSEFACQVAGEVLAFQLADYIPKGYRKSAKVMSRDITLAVVSAYHAVKDAGLRTRCLIDRGEAAEPPNVDSTRFGANIGAGLVCADMSELAGALATAADDQHKFSLSKWGSEGMNNLTPLWLLKFLPNMLACHVTIVHDAQAPSNTITCAEAASHLAIGEAFRTIARGDADVCICGGAESKTNLMGLSRPLLGGLLNSSDNESPQNASRPFGADRQGMVIAEGGGLVILESLEHALARKARVYAEVVGFGASTNSAHWTKTDLTGSGIALSLKKALKDAQVDAGKIDLVTPFGTGSREHDAAEMTAWNAVFGARLDQAWAISTRGTVGNSGAGAGAVDFATTVMALHRNTVPPSVNTDRLDSACRFRFAQQDPVDANATYAISAGCSVNGGQNGALVIKRYQE